MYTFLTSKENFLLPIICRFTVPVSATIDLRHNYDLVDFRSSSVTSDMSAGRNRQGSYLNHCVFGF